jgi:hypothetical protein
MADTAAPTTDPAPAPAPAPSPAPPAPAPAPLKPGYLTTEAWLSFITIVGGAIPTSGLVDNAPLAAKIVGLVVAALSAINYTIQRTALKRAYLAALGPVTPQATPSAKLLSVATLVLAAVAIGATVSSCAGTDCAAPQNAQSAQCVVENALVDCTGITTLPAAVAVAAPVVDTLIKSAQRADGSINWPAIETPLIDLVLQYGPCVIAQIWNDYMSGSSSVVATSSGSGIRSGIVVARVSRPAAEFAAEFERIRAKVAPGRHFKTSGGTL